MNKDKFQLISAVKQIKFSGQSLFEVVFAVGMVALILTAIVLLSTRSIKTADFSQNRAMAGKYAQEATEWFRLQRDLLGWDIFFAKADDTPVSHSFGSLVFDTTDTLIPGTVFSRSYTLSEYTTDEGDLGLLLEVKIEWTDSEGPHTVINSTKFTNWDR